MSLWICLNWTFRVNGITQYAAFFLLTMFSRFINVVAGISTYFLLWLNNIPLYPMDIPHFIYVIISWWTFELFSLFLSLFIYFEKEREQRRGREREFQERPTLPAWSLMRGWNSQTTRSWPESKSRVRHLTTEPNRLPIHFLTIINNATMSIHFSGHICSIAYL